MPTWKRIALESLPWTLEASLAAMLILELPDDAIDALPGQTPQIMAQAAMLEASERYREYLSAMGELRTAIQEQQRA